MFEISSDRESAHSGAQQDDGKSGPKVGDRPPAAARDPGERADPAQAGATMAFWADDGPGAAPPGGDLELNDERKADGVEPRAASEIKAASGSQGSPLPENLQRKFGASLGTDLSGVRVHTGGPSAAAARATGAQAYTLGQDIHFNHGKYDPRDPAGEELLAHEVAHTVQQRGAAGGQAMFKLEVSSPGDDHEHEADHAARDMVAGKPSTVSATGGGVARVSRKAEGPTAASPGATGIDAAASSKLNTLHVRNTQALAKLSGATGGKAGVIKTAIDNALAESLGGAATTASLGLSAAEDQAKSARDQLKPYTAEERASAEYRRALASQTQLDSAIPTQASPILLALTVPGEAGGGAAGGDDMGAAVLARLNAVAPKMAIAFGIKHEALAAGNLKGKARLDAAQAVRQKLLGLGADLSYVQKVLRSATLTPDVRAFLDGNRAPLEKLAGVPPAPETGAGGGDASGDSTKPGAVKGSTPLKPGGVDEKLKVKGDPSIDPSKGEVSVSGEKEAGKGKVTGGGSVDVMNDQNELKFEGAKFEAGYTWPGGANVKASGGFTQTLGPPAFDGKQWIVSYSVEVSGGGGGGGSHKGSGAGGGATIGHGRSWAGTKVFPSLEAAKAFYENGDPSGEGMSSLPNVEAAKAMKSGETRTVSDNTDVGGEASLSVGGVTFGAGGSYGDVNEAKLTKKEGEKVQVTVRDVDVAGVTGSVSTPLTGFGAGTGSATSESTTVEFDLATPEGKAAFSSWQASPKTVPAGPGVRVVSRGKGQAESTSRGASALWAGGSQTSTDGQFTETTADGKHTQTTYTGAMTDTAKDFALNKEGRSDSLEITKLDKEDAQYSIKTSISAPNDAARSHEQLAKLMGETQMTTASMKDAKASGKWSAEGTYSKEQIQKFMDKVAKGQTTLTTHGTEAGNPAEDLTKVLADPNATEDQKHRAMVQWFSERGPEATADMRSAIGEAPKYSVTLEGDAYITGAAGQAAFDAKYKAIEDRSLDPALDKAALEKLLAEVQDLGASENNRRQMIANPARYPDLPNGLRHELCQQIMPNIQACNALRGKIASKAKKEGAEGLFPDAALAEKWAKMSDMRDKALAMRRQANDRRKKHDGVQTLGSRSARNDAGRTISSNDTLDQVREFYKVADASWSSGTGQMMAAETMENVASRQTLGNAESVAKATQAVDAAKSAYMAAHNAFLDARLNCDKVYGLTRGTDWNTKYLDFDGGYVKADYGGMD
jgi:hypothetical protein